MLDAMLSAEVGDDVYGEDRTINRLQEQVADLLGKERALFVPTGVMSNQLCLKALTRPGDEVIVGHDSHIFNYETGAPALLSGVQLHTVPDPLGVMALDDLGTATREEAYYLPRTSVIAVEQTHNRAGGSIIPLDYLQQICGYGRSHNIGLHLDGARLFNACVASGIPASAYADGFDTVSICLSKGLGAPIGSVMAGSTHHVEIAHKFRKIWGGGWRQAGILAAAGIHALEHNVDRLAEDHLKAAEFARLLDGLPGLNVPVVPETNIVLLLVEGLETLEFAAELAERGVLLSGAFKGKLRAVFHMDVSMEQTRIAAREVAQLIAEKVPA